MRLVPEPHESAVGACDADAHAAPPGRTETEGSMGAQETGTGTAPAWTAGRDGFARVVAGVDGRRMGFEAARQAARLTASDGRLTLVAVVELFAALSGRWGAEPARWRFAASQDRTTEDCIGDLSERARASLGWAEAQVRATGPGEVLSQVVVSEVDRGLIDVARDGGADLVAVGAHGGRRLVDAALAEASAVVLHEAPCSVLVARPGYDPARFPVRVVVGIDGSAESLAALAAAAAIRRRAGGTLVVVTAGREQEPAVAALQGFDAPHDLVPTPDRPVDALVAAAQTADLTVVGSRGLHGARALGSVSERVAFRASSSVLVVRPG
jgi:nucleotide-binding universal stress UspA family protein